MRDLEPGDVLLLDGEDLVFLTTRSPLSSYGVPVLRVEGRPGRPSGDFGPADLVAPGATAAKVVVEWAEMEARTEEELQAARVFLRQWPHGPQLAEPS